MSLLVLRQEFTDKGFKVQGFGGRCSLERRPPCKPPAIFFKAFDIAKGDTGRLEAISDAIQITL